MRIVLDTNVFVSGIFFSGPPHHILRAWREGRVQIVYSPPILLEYERVLTELSLEFPDIKSQPFLHLLVRHGELVHPGQVSGIFCRDLEDVKFIACLLHSKARCLVSGDKDLLHAKVKQGLVLSPRQFCDRFL